MLVLYNSIHHSRAVELKACVSLEKVRAGNKPGSVLTDVSRAVLFGLATGGVYTASLVTKTAVGSYPAISPLPVFPEKPSAVCFLLHFPSARAAWPLASTLALCCPDFPPAPRIRK